MNYLVTLASHGEDGTIDRTESLDFLKDQCEHFDIIIDNRFIWSWERFKTTHLYQAYKHIMTMEHKLGYWLWKPYIVLDAMYQLDPDDIICWMDSDLTLCHDPALYIKHAQEHDIKVLGSAFRNSDWTREITYRLMNMEEDKYKDVHQTWGGARFLRRCPRMMQLMLDSLTYGTNEDILYGGLSEIPTRWLQSIMTNLFVYEGIEMDDKDRGIFQHPH